MKYLILPGAVLFWICLSSCNRSASDQDNAETIDTASVALGKELFSQHCSACHTFSEDGIGPQLGGLTQIVSPNWVRAFIKDPKSMIESGDERAGMLSEKFKTIMPSFGHFDETHIEAIIAYMDTRKMPERKKAKDDPNAIKDPIPERIPLSDIRIAIEPVAQIPFSSDEYPQTRICKLDFQPGTGKLFVVDLRGKLYSLVNGQPVVYLDMEKERPRFIHTPGLATGFGSFAFHPEFKTNGLLYTSHTEGPGSGLADFIYNDSIPVMLQWVLSEWKTDKPQNIPFTGTSREILRVNMVHSFHGVQEITFNPMARPGDEDYGLLYVGIGDGASVERGYPFLAGRPDRIWGSIIRIDPAGNNSANGKYGIPRGNPFAKSKDRDVVKEIYVYGFRNPHRISWSSTGQILASNIGHHNIEALNMIEPGRNYGWPVREGTFVMRDYRNMRNIFALSPDDSLDHITYPVAQYDHDEGNAISGGFEYTGSAIPSLKGKYVFGDIVNGRLFYVDVSALKQGSQAAIKEWRISAGGVKTTLVKLSGADKVDMRFGRDHRGELYILTKPDGKVYKLVSAIEF